jgi:hypothetical protein
MGKKEYKAPSIRSFTIQEPLAFACNVYNMQGSEGTYSGCNLLQDPHISC